MKISEKAIKNNLFKLNITTSPTVIFYKICKFLSRARDSEFEKENRLFLEEYWEVHWTLFYWYGYYLYNGIGGGKDENKAINLFKQAAFKGDEDAIDFCEKKNIEYPISEKNYLRIFKSALKLHKEINVIIKLR
ncbi:hypothetical protein F8M41_018634 [Gigaspora margarita]|uniref:Uncharacterized protein n=1 Tax=Gigaspora margarita TaxID=4874 RepID=A0A8H4EL91_GIGMA|nr:hypothetical protein F8M41_018634 [Gigaspora margarita]